MRVSAAWAVALGLGAIPTASAGYMPRRQRRSLRGRPREQVAQGQGQDGEQHHGDGQEEPDQLASAGRSQRNTAERGPRNRKEGNGRGGGNNDRQGNNSPSPGETPSPIISTIDATAPPAETSAPADTTALVTTSADDNRNAHQPSFITISVSVPSSVVLAPSPSQTQIIELPIESLPLLPDILSGLFPILPAATVTHTIFQMAPASLLTVTQTVTVLPSEAKATSGALSTPESTSEAIISVSQPLTSGETIATTPSLTSSETITTPSLTSSDTGIATTPPSLTSSDTGITTPPSTGIVTTSSVTSAARDVETPAPSEPLSTQSPTNETSVSETPASSSALDPTAPATDLPAAPPTATPAAPIDGAPFADVPQSLFSSVLSLGPPTGALDQFAQAATDLTLPRATSVALAQAATTSLPVGTAPVIHVGALGLFVSLVAMVLAA